MPSSATNQNCGNKPKRCVWSVIGREFTLATNQVDFAVPAKFGLTYRDRDNTDKTPLCIHRAPLGTYERFIGFLIEHYAGNFPLWLAPEQVRVLTIGDEEPLVNYAKAIGVSTCEDVQLRWGYGSRPVCGFWNHFAGGSESTQKQHRDRD